MAGLVESLRSGTAVSDAIAGAVVVGRAPRRTLSVILPGVLPIALLCWITLIAAQSGVLAAQVVGMVPSSERPAEFLNSVTAPVALVVLGLCLLSSLATRLLRPTAALPVAAGTGGVVVLAGAGAVDAVSALSVVSLLAAFAWLLGSAILSRVSPTNDPAIVRGPIAIGLGLGLLGLLFLAPAAIGQLNGAVIAASGAILLLLLALNRNVDLAHLAAEWHKLRAWKPPTLTWFETAIVGLTAGMVAFALLTAFAPENQTDAVRQHLPIAREIWQTGSVAEFSPMNVSGRPMQGHLLDGVAYGLAGVTGAKLVQALVGLTAITGVAGIGWLCAGRTAAIVSAAIFATAPLVLWELGHAFMDLFPVLYTVTAALCVLIWQRDGAARWLILAGALCGFGFAAKLNMGLLTVAFAVGIGIIGRGPWRRQDRLNALLVFGLGHLVIAPWLLRDVLIGGDLQSPGFLLKQFWAFAPPAPLPDAPVAPGGLASRAAELAISEVGRAAPAQVHGFGRSPLDLARGPWIATFRGGELGYPIIGRGEIGVAPLLLLPLTLIGPRGRSTAFLAVATFTSYVGWWLTQFQIARHLLPTLALLSALCGIGLAGVIATATSPARRVLATAGQAGLLVACAMAPAFLLASPRAQAPVDLLLGRETVGEYMRREIPSATALVASSAKLPPDTRLGYISVDWEGPQLYTEARLIYVSALALGSTPDEILASLDGLDIAHFIWNREKTSSAQNGSQALSTAFLRDHTRILAGDRNSYLFEVIPGPAPGMTWGAAQHANLLDDPELQRVRRWGGAWEVDGKIEQGRGAVLLTPRGAIRQRVPASAGASYVLTATGACRDPLDRASLALRWYDAHGATLSVSSEEVRPGLTPSEQFLWRRAPHNATSVAAEVVAAKGSWCDFTKVELNPLDLPERG